MDRWHVTSKYVSCFPRYTFSLAGGLPLRVYDCLWNVHGSGSSGLGILGDDLIRVKTCQLYACTVAIVQVQEKKHECSIVGRVCYIREIQDSSQRDQIDTCKVRQFAQSREPLYRVKHGK